MLPVHTVHAMDGWMMVVEKRIHHQPLIRSSRILLVQIIWAARADETAPN